MSEDMNLQTRAPIEILLVSDANYSAFLATTIVSILKNAAPDDALRFHIVDGGLAPSDVEKIESMKRIRAFESRYYRPDREEMAERFRGDVSSFPIVVYYRLFAVQYLPQDLDKILYLDVDTIVLSSLRELWETPLDDNFVAAVRDRNMRLSLRLSLGLTEDFPYFNSGVLAINLKKWREADVLSDVLKIWNEKKDVICFSDQDVLNVYASRNSYYEASGDWNCHPRNYVEGKTRVLHYMGRRHRCPHLELLFGYAALTPYEQLPMQSRGYKIKRALKRLLYDFLCLFVFQSKRRRVLRKRLNLR